MTNACEQVKEAIREELKKELSFVNDGAREKIAERICNKIHDLLDTSEEVEEGFRKASEKLGW